ncbi:hypothetical protein PDE_08549 [Penicillium oxalicum 114-2]|uniref:Microbial-type PARG catalytic domain-containing protein n=1 Tax=Penicillium oxalicum (strain 114-2 / CGMCC 5302) TaxID=933388 RepID=S8BEU0_PENO1|nr:hypothetical protein PDE_08549 [Penicillium oxalicum 114-2]
MASMTTKIKPWRYSAGQDPFGGLGRLSGASLRTQTAREIEIKAKEIVDACQSNFGVNVKFTYEDAPILDETRAHKCPNFSVLIIKVINKDTLDAAIALESASDLLDIQKESRVLVLNFANAETPGGAWRSGVSAQEEHIMFRTTLSYHGLDPSLYPWQDNEGIYTSNVLVLRENETRGFSWLWIDRPECLPLISVISVAAEQRPQLDSTGTRYATEEQRTRTQARMRCVLRMAADHGHSRLVLGALGCGVFGHPPADVADCWANVLKETEFKGWFEFIVFAVLDPKCGPNLKAFHAALHDIEI